jgi:hypothetical protein
MGSFDTVAVRPAQDDAKKGFFDRVRRMAQKARSNRAKST